MQALDKNMVHPKYLFLSYSMDGYNWWLSECVNDTNCTSMDYTKVLQLSLQVLPFHIRTDDEYLKEDEELVSEKYIPLDQKLCWGNEV